MSERRNVLKTYLLTIYDDSTIDFKPYKIENDKTKEISGSDRITQALMVIEKTLNSLWQQNNIEVTTDTVSYFVIKAIKEVSSQLNIKENTIRDKISRQIGFTHPEFVNSILEYFLQGIDILKQQLLNHISKKYNLVEDQNLINEKFLEFDNMRIQYPINKI